MDLKEKGNSEKRHPWELARLEVIKIILSKYFKNYNKRNILDIGCGDLFFIKNFSEDKNLKLFAVDTAFNDDFIENNCRSDLKLYKNLKDIDDKGLEFDIVFLMDVLEHIENDVEFLKELVECKFISEKTVFIITVPAFQKLFSSHDYFLDHYRRYNNTSLKRLINKSGLAHMESGYFFTSLLIPRFFEVLLEKLSRKELAEQGTGLTTYNSGKIFTTTFKNILLLDFNFQKLIRKFGIKLPGLSNYIVCKKPV